MIIIEAFSLSFSEYPLCDDSRCTILFVHFFLFQNLPPNPYIIWIDIKALNCNNASTLINDATSALWMLAHSTFGPSWPFWPLVQIFRPVALIVSLVQSPLGAKLCAIATEANGPQADPTSTTSSSMLSQSNMFTLSILVWSDVGVEDDWTLDGTQLSASG